MRCMDIYGCRMDEFLVVKKIVGVYNESPDWDCFIYVYFSFLFFFSFL